VRAGHGVNARPALFVVRKFVSSGFWGWDASASGRN
jgi:hypothetical protein